MRSRDWTLILAIVITICAIGAGGPVQSAAADHNGTEIADNEIVVVKTITTEGTEPGTVQLKESYHIGDDITRMTVFAENVLVEEILETNGFTEQSPNTYTWTRDESESKPSIRLTLAPQNLHRVYDRRNYASTSDWTLIRPPRNGYSYSWRGGSAGELSRVIKSPERGVIGSEMLYIGNYSKFEFASSGESFSLIVSNHTQRKISVKAIRSNLVNASDTLHVKGRSENVSVFVVTDPIDPGGTAQRSEFMIHECCVPPGQAVHGLYHEYMHTRQVSKNLSGSGIEWTSEAEATYYGFLLALQHGDMPYKRFRKRLSDISGVPTEVNLSDPDTWESTGADYEIGSRTIAALDAKIRNSSAGERTYQAVLRQKNIHAGNFTLDDMERYASEAAGTDLTSFFDTYIRSNSAPPDFHDRPELYIKQIDGWDSDNDGLTDQREIEKGTHPFDSNTDGDHLNDSVELEGDTDPLDGDTNDDGIVDGYEPDNNSKPLSIDSDGDGLTNEFERANGLNPNDPDTDGNGVPDRVDIKESAATAVNTESTERGLSGPLSTEKNDSLYATQTRGADGPGFGFPALIITFLFGIYMVVYGTVLSR